MIKLNLESLRVIFPPKFRTLVELAEESGDRMLADEMVLKVMSWKKESTASYIIEMTGLAESTVSKCTAKLGKNKSIRKELRTAKAGQSGNGKRAYFSVV